MLLVALVLLAYLPVLRAGFIWDDDALVYRNPHVTEKKGVFSLWYKAEVQGQLYPLTYTFFWLQYRWWGCNPFGFHLSNILLQIVDVLLLWTVLRKLRLKGAWWVAVVFGLHPLMVESVAWVSEAKNVFSAVFYLLALLAFLRFENRGKIYNYFSSLLLYLMALLSKTFVLTFPLVLILLKWYRDGAISAKFFRRMIPFFALSLLAGAFTWIYEVRHVGVAGGNWEMSILERWLVAGKAFWFYLGKLVFPVRLAFVYDRWQLSPRSVGNWAFPVLAVSFLVFLWRGKTRFGRGPFTALALYTVCLLPALGFVSFYAQKFSFVADHYSYLAVIGPIALLASGAGLDSAVKCKKALGGIIIVCLFFLTFSQSYVYRDQETIWRDTLDKNPRAWMAHANLGTVLLQQGRNAEALEHYHQALEIDPPDPEVLGNFGMALFQSGKSGEAIECYLELIRLKPDDPLAHTNLGIIFQKCGKLDAAIAHYQRAIHHFPDYWPAHYNLGSAFFNQGDFTEAVASYDRALEIEPDHGDTHYYLGLGLARLGKWNEAARHLEKAMDLGTRVEETREALAGVRRRLTAR